MKVLPSAERIKTLENLFDAQQELLFNLEKFPILSQHAHRSNVAERDRKNLEDKLAKVIAAIKRYQNPPVYVPM